MWRLEHSVRTRADAETAWRFWTNVATWSVDPGVERVAVDPAFVSGARGVTVTADGGTVTWFLPQVGPGRTAHIEIPAPGVVLHARWCFEPADPGGAVLTQEMWLSGEGADTPEAVAAGEVLAAGVPAGMQRLADAIDALEA